jgi:hypothetical protein
MIDGVGLRFAALEGRSGWRNRNEIYNASGYVGSSLLRRVCFKRRRLYTRTSGDGIGIGVEIGVEIGVDFRVLRDLENQGLL